MILGDPFHLRIFHDSTIYSAQKLPRPRSLRLSCQAVWNVSLVWISGYEFKLRSLRVFIRLPMIPLQLQRCSLLCFPEVEAGRIHQPPFPALTQKANTRSVSKWDKNQRFCDHPLHTPPVQSWWQASLCADSKSSHSFYWLNKHQKIISQTSIRLGRENEKFISERRQMSLTHFFCQS